MATLSTKTLKTLWGRAGGRCSHPDCRLELFHDEDETTDPTLIGENCHISAEKAKWARFDSTMLPSELNSYPNLILLCRNHHKMIDDQANGEKTYSVNRLQTIKKDHEIWVRQQLDFDNKKQKDDELYAALIDRWQQLAHVDEWLAWSSHILSAGQPRMRRDLSVDLEQLSSWLVNRIWPNRYEDLENAFENFRRILQDFCQTFFKHAKVYGEAYFTQKFYKMDRWDEEEHQILVAKYEFHVDLVQDLMLELSRAANLVCDLIRRHIIFSYRRLEGHLMVQSGPHMDLSFRDFVVKYQATEIERSIPYKGLDDFYLARSLRDHHFGQGKVP